MRKIILIAIFLCATFFGRGVDKVLACVDWCAGSTGAVTPNPDGTCDRWTTLCCDAGGGSQTCDAGWYACNRLDNGGGSYLGCCPVGDGSCFLPGTKVETVEGSKNIETMSIGDRVKSFDDKDKVVNASVSDVMKFSRDYYFELEAGDYQVKVTAEHPFYAGDGEFKEIQSDHGDDSISFRCRCDRTNIMNQKRSVDSMPV